jgi:hypothetical protein
VVHRDVKPANALAEGPGGRVKLTDFGLCRAAHEASLTRSGAVAGTPLYMSPEQARGDALDHRSDLFSLGAVLYALATGVPPFRAPHPIGVLNRVLKDRPVPPRKLLPDLPRSLEAVVMQLLEKSPHKRPADAAEVERLLASVLAEPEPRKPRRRRGLAAAGLFGFAAFLLAVTTIRLTTPDGVLVVEVDDPEVKITLDGTDVVVSGAGPHEVRLKPGAYTLRAGRDGKEVRSEALTIERGGKRVVRISLEPLARRRPAEGRASPRCRQAGRTKAAPRTPRRPDPNSSPRSNRSATGRGRGRPTRPSRPPCRATSSCASPMRGGRTTRRSPRARRRRRSPAGPRRPSPSSTRPRGPARRRGLLEVGRRGETPPGG